MLVVLCGWEVIYWLCWVDVVGGWFGYWWSVLGVYFCCCFGCFELYLCLCDVRWNLGGLVDFVGLGFDLFWWCVGNGCVG